MRYPATAYIHSDDEPHKDGTHARIPLVDKDVPDSTEVVGYLGVHPDDLPVSDALHRARLKRMDPEEWASRRGYIRLVEDIIG
jgi:hypothetical protein